MISTLANLRIKLEALIDAFYEHNKAFFCEIRLYIFIGVFKQQGGLPRKNTNTNYLFLY